MPPDETCAHVDISDGVARLTLNRPARRNAVNAEKHNQLRAILDVIESDASIRTLVITGAGAAFCAGQDLAERGVMLAQGEIDLQASVSTNYNPLIKRIIDLPFPVISAVNGIASGAGAMIALAADIVIAAKSAKFQFGFSRIGLAMDSGASWLLPRLVGLPRAKGLALLAEPLDAETAERWGLIWRSVVDADLHKETELAIRHILTAASGALAAIKRQFDHANASTLAEALAAEAVTQGHLGRSKDYREGVNAFLQKRTPKFG